MKSNLNVFFLIAMIALVGIVVYFVLKPFLVPFFLAFVIYQLFKKWYKKINQKMDSPSVSSLLTCSLLFLILIIPFLITISLVTNEASTLYQKIQGTDWQPHITSITNFPILEKVGINAENLNIKNIALDNSQEITQGTQNIGSFMFFIIKSIYQQTSHILFMIFVMFFTLYYLFKDGEKIMDKIMGLSPLRNKDEYKLLDNFVSISRATLKGSLVIAIIQGVLMILVFLITGVSSPVLWGVITVIFSLIPLVGSAFVWLPVGIVMLLLGHVWQSITILVIGGVVISSIDNVLRPKLVGNESSLHPLLVFFSILGGIAFFGISGFLFGPIIVVLFLSLLDIYKSEFKAELKKLNQ